MRAGSGGVAGGLPEADAWAVFAISQRAAAAEWASFAEPVLFLSAGGAALVDGIAICRIESGAGWVGGKRGGI